MLAKAKAKGKTKVKHIYSTGIIYDRHLWSSKYFIIQATAYLASLLVTKEKKVIYLWLQEGYVPLVQRNANQVRSDKNFFLEKWTILKSDSVLFFVNAKPFKITF